MGTLANLARNKERLREVAQRVAKRLDAARVMGEAGSGAVRVTANGQLRIVLVEISPALVTATDASHKELAEGLIAEATNRALAQARLAARDIINDEAQGLGLPELPEDLGGVL